MPRGINADGHLAIGSRGNELATLLAAAPGVLSVSTPSEWRLSGTPWTDAQGISVRLCSVIGSSLSELAAETIHVVAAIKTYTYCLERVDAFEADVALQGRGIRRLRDPSRRGHKAVGGSSGSAIG
jgi:hypothetical protein